MDLDTMPAPSAPTSEEPTCVSPPPLPGQRSDMNRPPLPQKSGAERRRAPRKQLETEIGFFSDSNFFTGFTEDVSEGGLFVATYDLQPIGSEIEVEFTLPGGYEVKVKGTVRWLRDPIEETPGLFPGMGVQFGTLGGPDKDAIEEFINNRAPMFYDSED